MKEKPTIFVVNDDGITAPGIRALIEAVRPLGRVVVVAPDSPQSGVGHAITTRNPLRIQKIDESDDYTEYSCSGTPVDCVKVGEQIVLKKKPDLMVCGINHGSNAAINIVYSGTMAAVIESAIGGVPSVGFSLLDYSYKADFSACAPYVRKICENILNNGLEEDTCLNVNIPAAHKSEIKGIKVCRQAKSRWVEEFDIRKDPQHRHYFWLTGIFEKLEEEEDTDDWALQNNYVTIVPVEFDFTAHHLIPSLKKWDLDV
jgi:5'-nucleotidase